MSFGFGNKHRTRGKGFKLFSDELPRIEFDKTSLDEYEQNVSDRKQARGRRRTNRDSGHDRMSLPSLGTPDWEMLSDFDSSRPNSMQSPPFNPLNPNFTKIHQKIQRRHTLKDAKTNNGSVPRRISFRDKFVNDKARNESKTAAWIRQNSTSPQDDHESAKNGKRTERLETSEDIVVSKPPIPKKKSIFKELLEASAKENTRMNRIKESLRMGDKIVKRSQSLREFTSSKNESPRSRSSHQDKEVDYVDTRVPEIISQKETHGKPGILKRGARVRDSHVLNPDTHGRESFLKPRLVHQEDLSLPKGHHKPGNDAVNEVRVSVYTESPMNRVTDMHFVPLPSSKPRGKAKRVNFHHHDIIKEVTETSESDLREGNEEQKDDVNNNERRYTPVKLKRYPTIKAPKPTVSSAMKAFKTERVSKFLNGPASLVHPSLTNNEDKQNSIDVMLMSPPSKSPCRDPHNDPSWKEVKSPEEPEKGDDPVDTIAHVNFPLNIPHESPLSRPVGFSPHPRLANPLTSPLGHVTDPTNYTPSRTPDLDSLSELTAIFDDDDFDLADLPDEIDRSLLGEDLIKAYRLWDRKRKAFPGGLRKIDAPVDRPQPMFPKQYGSLKTYKIPSQVDIKSGTGTSKPPQKSVLIEWV